MNIYLLRHGETDWNKQGLLQGHTDIPLNQNGRSQMEQAAKVMQDFDLRIDLIIASPLSRARESAEIVARHLSYDKDKIIVEPMLIERYFGEGEGKTQEERAEKYPGDNYPGMESFEDFIRRAHSVFEKIVTLYADKQSILLAAHGAILYAILTAITNGQIEYGGKKVTFDQGSIYMIKYTDAGIEVLRYNEDSKGFVSVDYKS